MSLPFSSTFSSSALTISSATGSLPLHRGGRTRAADTFHSWRAFWSPRKAIGLVDEGILPRGHECRKASSARKARRLLVTIQRRSDELPRPSPCSPPAFFGMA